MSACDFSVFPFVIQGAACGITLGVSFIFTMKIGRMIESHTRPSKG